MNEHVDTRDMLLDWWRGMGRADKCRIVDLMIQELGPTAPIPVFEDIHMDAKGWAVTTDIGTQVIYMSEMWSLWPAAKQQGCIDWMVKNKKGAQNV